MIRQNEPCVFPSTTVKTASHPRKTPSTAVKTIIQSRKALLRKYKAARAMNNHFYYGRNGFSPLNNRFYGRKTYFAIV